MACSHKVLTDREAKAEGSGVLLHIDKCGVKSQLVWVEMAHHPDKELL